jgi:fused signal recognition particle receptor
MRLFRKGEDRAKGLWKRIVDLALTDVKVLAKGMDNESLEQLEERLLAADFGVQATLRLVDRVEDLARRGRVAGGAGLREALREEVAKILLRGEDLELAEGPSGKPTVYLVVGVNGVGKTTSVAKLAFRLKESGRSVLLGAADTYRAGAVDQLEAWAMRIGVEFVRGKAGGDPAAVAFDAVEAGISRGVDVVLFDSAGRLHTNVGLMEELRKVNRVVSNKLDGAPHETLIVLDATVGQNAHAQVEVFREMVAVTGLVVTKVDGSAKGGVVVALAEKFGLPVYAVGVGEGMEDMRAFEARSYARSLLGLET